MEEQLTNTMTETLPKKKPSPQRGRAETERRLIEVALKLIEENGILAGLNLRQVAEGAGVNRGNIYHYFGSRQELLRAAISQRFNALVNTYTKIKERKGFVARRIQAFRSNSLNGTSDSILRALLVLDGDDTVDPMPLYERQLSQLKQDVIDGDIDKDHDLAALQVALSAFVRGYKIFRLPFAKRTGLKPSELDDRVSEILSTWLKAMAQPPRSH